MFRSSNRFRLAAALVSGALALAAVHARAAEEVVVSELPVEQNHYQFGLSEAVRTTQGSFDPYGYYLPNPAGSTNLSFMTTLSGSYRFNKEWEAGLMLPIRQSRMIMPTGDSSSQSMGGISANVRYHYGGWPHLVLHGGMGTPWSMKHTVMNGNPRDSLNSEDIADGFLSGTSVRFGAGVSRTFKPFRIALDVTTMIPLTTSEVQSDPSQPVHVVKKAMRYQSMEGVSYTLAKAWTINTGLKQTWAGDNSYDGIAADGTASRMFTSNVGVSYGPSREWRWTAGYDSQWPFYAYAVNQPYSPSVSLSMMYSVE